MSQEAQVSTLRTVKTKSNAKIVELAHAAGSPSRDKPLNAISADSAYIHADPTLNTPIVGFNAAAKRLCDFTIGSIALLVLLPIFIIISVIIKLNSTGPALFYQQRRGRNGAVIKVYKFRTMYQDYSTPIPTATSFKQTRKDDPRVTNFGALLRKTSLDELPQLINVIQGSMSLVGPRPHPIPLDEEFKRIIPSLNSRYTVKPGVTGWAQVNGLRGETLRMEDMAARIEHDRFYIKNWTLWLDVKILAVTAIKGWTHRNAY